MEKEFVPYELAVKLKELGFKEKCIGFYNGKHLDWLIDDDNGLNYPTINPNMDVGLCVKAPLWQQAFDWFREKYNLYAYIRIGYIGYSSPSKTWDFSIYDDISLDYPKLDEKGYSGYKGFTYEEAQLACLEKLIELVENGK